MWYTYISFTRPKCRRLWRLRQEVNQFCLAWIFLMTIKRIVKFLPHIFSVPQSLRAGNHSDGSFKVTSPLEKEKCLKNYSRVLSHEFPSCRIYIAVKLLGHISSHKKLWIFLSSHVIPSALCIFYLNCINISIYKCSWGDHSRSVAQNNYLSFIET